MFEPVNNLSIKSIVSFYIIHTPGRHQSALYPLLILRLDIFLNYAIFLNRKTMIYRKALAESEVEGLLKNSQLLLSPLRFDLVRVEPKFCNERTWDFELRATWGNQTAKLAVEYKSLSTPKAFEELVRICTATRLPEEYLPMMLLPYLRPDQLEKLVQIGISGVDLCGNGVVIVPHKFQVFRSGLPNQFSTDSPIKNIYRKNTSMVARVLLTAKSFGSVQEVLAEINRRNTLAIATGETPMRMGTVSKALKQLEGELIIDKNEGINLLQPEKLLDKLQQNYEPLKKVNRIRLKVDCDFAQLPGYIGKKINSKNASLIATGLSSVSRYAVMQREEVLSLYCPKLPGIQEIMNGKENDNFPNLELIETDAQPLYFDARPDERFMWASPVQTYLELMHGDKRDRETADQVKSYILRSLKGEN